MLPSTFVALRIHGLDAEPLRRASMAHFYGPTPFDVEARDRFWREFVRARRAYRKATQEEVELVLART